MAIPAISPPLSTTLPPDEPESDEPPEPAEPVAVPDGLDVDTPVAIGLISLYALQSGLG